MYKYLRRLRGNTKYGCNNSIWFEVNRLKKLEYLQIFIFPVFYNFSFWIILLLQLNESYQELWLETKKVEDESVKTL